jgi:hypothetical protein
MDNLQLISLIVATVVGIITAIIAIINFRKSIIERKLDLLWKKANAAKEFVGEIHENQFSGAAISMLDWFVIDKTDNYDKKRVTEIKYSEVLAAIPKISSKSYDDKEHYILECFDWFFYFIDRAEQHINDGLFLFDNVKYVFFPYYKKIKKDMNLYELFMQERCYLLAPNFWKRFEADPGLVQS